VREAIWHAFTRDIPIKLIALAMAIALFVVVRSDKDAATGVFVRVVYTLPSDRVLVSEPVSEVKIAIRGPWTRIQRLDDRELEPIRIDLSTTKETVLHFTESMVKLPPGLRVVSMTPTQTKLDFEPRAEREVPVQRPFRVTDATGEVRDSIALESLPRATQYVEAASVTLTADIRPAIVERTLESVPITVTGLSHLDGDAEPKSATIILRGPYDIVRRVSLASLQVFVDARLEDSRPPALFKKRVEVSGLPGGVAAEAKPDSVLLSTHRRHE
jgi:YbbR domain-containing protein